MCLYNVIGKNKKYEENQKNGGIIPTVYDERVLYVPRECRRCMECRKRKAREWQIRLYEDIKEYKNGKFITLTFSNESILKLDKEIPRIRKDKEGYDMEIEGYERDNKIATLAVRKFTERWRKKHKKTIRHMLVTELGHEGTENIHLHGILYTDEGYKEIRDKWEYGYIYPRESEEEINYVNNQSVNYITKYINKMDIDHPNYISKILASKGIGAYYIKSGLWIRNKFNGKDTITTYKTDTGHNISLPKYYRDKIYNEEEREKLWIMTLDKETRYIMGEKINVKENDKDYLKTREHYRRINIELGYGTNKRDDEAYWYEVELRNIRRLTRINEAKQHQSTWERNTMNIS